VTAFALHAALTTPFDDRGDPELDAVRSHIELLIEDGIDGLVVAGTTGEGPLLEEGEVEALVAAAAEAAGDRLEVIAHVGRASTAATVRLAGAAVRAGADALIAVTPYYFALGDEALFRHYLALLGAVDAVPLLGYTFPDRTGNQLSAEVLDRLAAEGLAGLKDSTGSAERHRQYLEVGGRHQGLRVMVGSERLALLSLAGGGAGSISALANARADVLRTLRDERSEEAQDAVNSARAALPDIAALKRAVSERLVERGVRYSPAMRPPL
jgi:dihydrodipicolinate synthase/N-acetylneuraminate lyase